MYFIYTFVQSVTLHNISMEVAVAISNTVNKNKVLLSRLRKENKEKRRQHCIFSSIHRFNMLSVSSKPCC
jgi:hypothetical protein